MAPIPLTLPRLVVLLLIVVALLMVPLISMQFSSEVNWTAFDFSIMGVLLTGLLLLGDLILRRISSTWGRVGLLIGLFLLFMLVWVQLAVGIFGSPLAGT